jgi:hypothetical protein
MPVLVNAELGSGLAKTRGFKVVEPEDVANEIVIALQLCRFDVYVPRSVGRLFRVQAPFPRRASEAVARFLKADEVLARPDRVGRAAYEARMATTILAAAATATAAAAEVPAAESAPCGRRRSIDRRAV